MKQNIIQIAEEELELLRENYDKFIAVFVDDWRGYRFVFDSNDVRNCNNNCAKCDLFNLLKDKPDDGVFASGLLPATENDKRLFGEQNFLNCKTYEQYIDCYVAFLVETELTREEVEEELGLVKNMKIVYCRDGKIAETEANFKDEVLRKALAQAVSKKKDLILDATKKLEVEQSSPCHDKSMF